MSLSKPFACDRQFLFFEILFSKIDEVQTAPTLICMQRTGCLRIRIYPRIHSTGCFRVRGLQSTGYLIIRPRGASGSEPRMQTPLAFCPILQRGLLFSVGYGRLCLGLSKDVVKDHFC